MNENMRQDLGWVLIDGTTEIAKTTKWFDLEEVISRLPEVASTPNALCTLVSPSGKTLSVGVALPGHRDNPTLDTPVASVTYEASSGELPYLIVLGDDALTYESGGVIVFRFEGEWTEILRRNCVAVETMLRIVKDFFETETLPQWIEWEEV
jgi:hypothetical protein